MTEKREYMVNVLIPEACLHGDEDCPCVTKAPRVERNPV